MGSYNWTINVSNDQIGITPQYILRFVDHTDQDLYPTTKPMLPSPAFILHPAAKQVSASTQSPSSAPATPTSSPSSTATPSSSQPSSQPSSQSTQSETKSTNVGAIAGGVLGGIIGLALILVGVLFILKKQKKKDEGQPCASEMDGRIVSEMKDSSMLYNIHEMPSQLPESQGNAGGADRHVAELDSGAATHPSNNKH